MAQRAGEQRPNGRERLYLSRYQQSLGCNETKRRTTTITELPATVTNNGGRKQHQPATQYLES